MKGMMESLFVDPAEKVLPKSSLKGDFFLVIIFTSTAFSLVIMF